MSYAQLPIGGAYCLFSLIFSGDAFMHGICYYNVEGRGLPDDSMMPFVFFVIYAYVSVYMFMIAFLVTCKIAQ